MTCETCASGHRYWFDFNCLRCRARHYVLILLERERLAVRLEMQARGELKDFLAEVERELHLRDGAASTPDAAAPAMSESDVR